jgi:hypothetical protein
VSENRGDCQVPCALSLHIPFFRIFYRNKTSTYIVEAVNSKLCVPDSIFSVAFDRGRNGIRFLKAEKLGDGTPDWPDTLSNFAAVIFGGRSWLFLLSIAGRACQGPSSRAAFGSLKRRGSRRGRRLIGPKMQFPTNCVGDLVI